MSQEAQVAGPLVMSRDFEPAVDKRDFVASQGKWPPFACIVQLQLEAHAAAAAVAAEKQRYAVIDGWWEIGQRCD